MWPVHSAIVAKLFEFEPIRRLLFVLGRGVIPVFALGTLKRNVISCHFSILAAYFEVQRLPSNHFQ